jgi:choline dehydrogenase-like flavoprotein
MYDAIIVGARCAGSPTALLLARKGYRVLLLDRWLAEAIDDGFCGRRSLEQALAGYEQKRNEAELPYYELTAQLARLEPPPPEMQSMLEALVDNPEQRRRFFGVLAHTVPVPEFFSPENIRQMVEGRKMVAAGGVS